MGDARDAWWVLSRVSWAVPVLRGVCALARNGVRPSPRSRVFFFARL
jgi:hypothetical protein